MIAHVTRSRVITLPLTGAGQPVLYFVSASVHAPATTLGAQAQGTSKDL